MISPSGNVSCGQDPKKKKKARSTWIVNSYDIIFLIKKSTSEKYRKRNTGALREKKKNKTPNDHLHAVIFAVNCYQ